MGMTKKRQGSNVNPQLVKRTRVPTFSIINLSEIISLFCSCKKKQRVIDTEVVLGNCYVSSSFFSWNKRQLWNVRGERTQRMPAFRTSNDVEPERPPDAILALSLKLGLLFPNFGNP
ncbi:hypothetical protein QQP08_011714 [Theobroma cacao]|nr:hypothetical protein QQP08_011714 [Theobroma cacao]